MNNSVTLRSVFPHGDTLTRCMPATMLSGRGPSNSPDPHLNALKIDSSNASFANRFMRTKTSKNLIVNNIDYGLIGRKRVCLYP